ncbi:MAG: hypothetical protein AAGH99_16085, partial [Planctomycetota bacterium]
MNESVPPTPNPEATPAPTPPEVTPEASPEVAPETTPEVAAEALPAAPVSSAPASDPSADIDAQVQAELDAAGGGVDQLIEQSIAESNPAPQAAAEGDADSSSEGGTKNSGGDFHHQVVRGRISAIRGEDVFIDITGGLSTEGAKLQGVLPLAQFDRPPRMGSIMDFVVDKVNDQEGLVYLSREGAVSLATWDQLTRGSVVEARVTKSNKGGLELEMIGGIRAFMP